MSAFIFEDINDLDAETARATALFFEADELDTLVYGILDTEDKTDQVLQDFAEAKAIADAKRAEATEILARVKQLRGDDAPD